MVDKDKGVGIVRIVFTAYKARKRERIPLIRRINEMIDEVGYKTESYEH